MLHKTFFITILSIVLLSYLTNAQCPVADFNLPTTVCKGENFDIVNSSTGGVKFEWDFCSGDLESTTQQTAVITNDIFHFPSFITIVSDSQNWYGFVVSRFGQKIIRLDFGTDLKNIPTIVDLGSFQGAFIQPIDIEFFKENGVWYALMIDVSSHKLSRFVFDSIEDTTPNLQSLDNFNNLNLMNAPVDIEILYDNNKVVALITNYNGAKITQANFGNSIANAPSGLNISVPGALTLQGIASLKTCDIWTVLTTSTDNHKVFSLKFMNVLDNNPVITEVIPSGISFSAPMGIDLVVENSIAYAFIQSTAGDVYRLKNADVATPDGANLGKLSTLGSTNEGLSLVRSGTDWYAFLVNIVSNKITRVDFKLTCTSNIPISIEENPAISFTQSGTYSVSLKAYDSEEGFSSLSKNITVTANEAPLVMIQLNQISCVETSNIIEAIADNPASIISYSWNLGDGNISNGQSISYPYLLPGIYKVVLSAQNSVGCSNQAKTDIKIYDKPVNDFTVPPGLICTNTEFTFTNTTLDNFDGNLTYQWFVESSLESTSRDLKYTFSSSGNKDIKLKTYIPGCSNELTKTLNSIEVGPTVGFDYEGQCEKELIQFNNTSSGNISGYTWDFGNGKTSTAVNESQSYSSIGNYVVSLQTTGTNGCVSSTNKTLIIYSTPQPDFSLDLPPFSCSGTPSQFNDLTPGPPDSNLSQWNWSFGDTENGIAELKNPTYTYAIAGSYDVSLTTATNFGCAATKVKTIQIAESPKADFTMTPTCLNQPTNFTDASGTTNKAWLWKVGSNSYTIQNPSHVFSESGTFAAQLAVTGNNDCVSILSKPIDVPIPPTLDFSVQNNCSGQNTIFTDVTSQNSDPAELREWDFGGLGNGLGESAQFSFSTPGAHSVKLTVTNQSGCLYALEKNTSIEISPIAEFTSSDESGPPPLFVQFTNASLRAASYEWKFNDADSTISQLESPSFTYLTLGDFIVDLTARSDRGCVDAKSKVIHIIVPVTEIELEDFTLLLNPTTGSVRPVLSIRNNSNYTLHSVEVVLDIAGNALVKEKISATILPNTSSTQILNYELLTNGNKLDYLCAEISLTEDRLSDEIDVTDNSACLSLESTEILFPPYPNPIHGELHMDWISAAEGSVKVTVVSQMGQLAYQMDVPGVGIGLNQIVLDLSKLNSGFYMLIFESAEIRKTFPFVILN